MNKYDWYALAVGMTSAVITAVAVNGLRLTFGEKAARR